MRACLALVLTLLLLCPAFAEDADRKYTLKFDWKPVVGAKIQESVLENTSTKMKISSGGQVVKEEENEKVKSYEYVVEILGVSGEDLTAAKWSFTKASLETDGEEVVYAFQGKTVSGKRDDAKKWTFTYEDGGEVAAEDLAALEDACDTGAKKEGKPSGEEVFAPKEPVKAGDSWSPDMEIVAKSFGGDGPEIDIKESKGTCMLKSVENRDGAMYGVIQIQLDMGMIFPMPVKLDKALPFKVSGEINACIDDTQPDGTMKMEFLLAGKSKGTVTQKKNVTPIELEMETKGTVVKTKKQAK